MSFITRFIIRRAGWVALAGLLLAIFGGYYSVHLFSNLRTEIEELLPKELDEQYRIGGKIKTHPKNSNQI